MHRLVIPLSLVLTLAMRPLACAVVDETRVKACVARFLGVPEDQIRWPKTIDAREGAPSWRRPISLRLSDPPTAEAADGVHVVTIDVHARDYYVQHVSWDANLPREDAPRGKRLSTSDCLRTAERFARSKVRPWPRGMRLGELGIGPVGLTNPWFFVRWDDWDGPARTGTYVRIRTIPEGRSPVCTFSQYLAPPHALSEVKIGREEALRLGREAALKLGLENPRVLEDGTGLWLSEPSCERPHWKIGFDYDNRQGGFLYRVYIDAVTGEVMKPDSE